MPVPKKTDGKIITPMPEVKPAAKPQTIQTPEKEEDRIDFINVKDMIKGMEKQKENGFHKKITDNGHDETEKAQSLDKTDSESSETLSRSNSMINGMQVPKPLPRSSISEAGSASDDAEAPKPKPRTTAMPVSGYKVFGVVM